MAFGDVRLEALEDGFSAYLYVEGFSLGATYQFGLGSDNADTGSARLGIQITSFGYTGTTLGTRVRASYGKGTIRKPFPEEAQRDETIVGGELRTRIALSDPIFAKDKSGIGNSGTDPWAAAIAGLVVNTGGGGESSNATPSITVTNNSTLPYPKVGGRWAQPGFERWTADKLVEFVAYQPFARDGKPLACLAFDFTDGTNPTTQQLVTECNVSTQFTEAGNKVWVYSATIPNGGFTQGATITGRARCYPWIGDATSVLDTDVSADGVAAPSSQLTPLMGVCDKNDSLACYARITIGAVGGAVSNTKAGARSSPFPTLASALTALKAYNNTNNSDNTVNNCYVLCGDGNWTAAGTFAGLNTKTWCVIQADTEDGATRAGVVFNTATNQAFNGYLKYENVSFAGTGAGMFRGNVLTSQLWIDNVAYGHAAAAQWYSWLVGYMTRTVFTTGTQNILGSGSGSVAWALIRNNDLTGISAKQGCANCLLGNKNVTVTMALSGGTNGPQSENAFVGWNSAYSLGSTTQFIGTFITNDWTKPTVIIGNVAERIAGNTTPLCQLLADGTTTSIGNCFYLAHNTWVGARLNLNYLELGNYSPNRLNWYDQNNVLSDWNIKCDVFQNAARTVTDGLLVAGSNIVNSAAALWVAGDVGQNLSFDDNQVPNAITTITAQTAPNATMAAVSNVNASGVTLYIKNYGKNTNRRSNWAMVNGCNQKGLRTRVSNFPPDNWGINSKAGTVTFIDDRSFEGSNTGGGDYHGAVGSSILNVVPSGGALLPGDLDGRPISNTGTGSSGALQPPAPTPPSGSGILTGIASDILQAA